MATPFAVFRKHQRAMMAVIGILCMIAFAVGGMALDFVDGQGGGRQDPVVATTNAGEFRATDLNAMATSRQLANLFVRETLLSAYGDSAQFKAIFELRMSLDAPFGEATERAVMETHIKAQRAADLGVVIGDDAINEFLREISDDKVTADAFRSIVKRLNTVQPLVFAALRTELSARKLEEMVFTSIHATPAQRWDYYQRLNSRATVEVLPVAVDKFVDQVKDPSESVLLEFFDAHKTTEPQPASSEPGFKVPQKAVFQYFKADYNKFYDEKAVTQEEIEKHYESAKDRDYLYTSLGAEEEPAQKPEETKVEKEPSSDEPAADKEEPGAATTEGEPADTEPEGEPAAAEPTDGEPADTEPTEGDKKTEEEPSSEDEAAGESSTDEGPADGSSAGDLPSEGESTPAGENEEDSKGEESTSDDGANLESAEEALVAGGCGPPPADTEFAPVRMLQDESNEETSDASDKPSTGEEPEADAVKSEKSESDAVDGTAPDGKPSAAKKTAKAPPPIASDLLLPTDIRQGENPKYDPLWKVEGSIRKLLAGQKAVARIDEVLNDEQSKMRRFAAKWTNWSVAPDAAKEPKKLDFAAEAAANGLTAHETSLVSASEVKQLFPDLASAKVDGQDFSFAAYDNIQLYQSRLGQDSEGNRYLFWATDNREAYIPELTDVRKQVTRAWKLIEARSLAQKKADEMVDKAKTAKKPLADVFASEDGVKVVETKPFSWMTTGTAGNFNSRQPPRLSEVEGPDGLAVEDAGDDFMRQVFSMEVGDVGSAMNQSQSIVYVTRLTSLEPSRATLRELFMVYPFQSYSSVAGDDQNQLYAKWLDEIRADVNLKWVRAPDDAQTR